MRTATDISIKRAIIHGVNAKKADGLLLSEASLPITAKHPVSAFLSNHIQNGLQDQALRAARFQDDAGSLSDWFRRIIEGKANFVDASCEIATKLYEIMQTDERVSPGTLAVCFYAARNHGHVARYLAVLKLDPGDAFKTSVKKDGKGRRIVTLDELKDVMPRTGERLQKCAFVRPLAPRPDDYDLMVLDRQHAASEPAQFFTQRFLNAMLASDPSTLTKQFFKAAFSGLNSVRDQINYTEYERLRAAITGAIHTQTIDIDDWGTKLRAPAVARAAIVGAVKNVIPDATFETDAGTADDLTKTRTIRGRHELKLVFDAAHSQEVIYSSKSKSNVNKGNYQEIVLHVQDFREESK